MSTMLSEHFSLAELTKTNTGLANVPGPEVMGRLENLARNMELVRAFLGKPVDPSSGYRSLAVNMKVRGSKTSDHMNGDACDFTCPDFGTPLEVADALHSSGIKFDQLILEYGWVHISFGPRMRQMSMTKRSKDAPLEHGINA